MNIIYNYSISYIVYIYIYIICIYYPQRHMRDTRGPQLENLNLKTWRDTRGTQEGYKKDT